MQSESASHSATPVWVRHENASRGSSGDDAERSRCNITANATIAAAISPSFKSGDATTDVPDVAAIATQIKATRPAGTRERDVRLAGATGGRMKKAAVASATAATAAVTKALRQSPK